MQIRGRLTRLVLAAAAALAMWVSAGCSGGGGSGIPVAPIGAPLAPKLPTVAAFSGTTTATPPASAGPASVTVPLATSGSFGGSVVVPLASVPPNFRLQLTYSTAPPPGLPALAAVSRTPLGRTSGAHVRAPLDTFSTSIVYACFTANYIVTLNGAPQYTFVLPPHFAPDGILYYLSIYQASQWVNGYGGPGAVVDSSSATTVTVAGRFPFTINADGTPECVSLHASWDTSPSPVPATPAPSPPASTSPSPVPSPSASAGASPSPGPSTAPSTLTVDPGTLTFTSSATQTFVATATGYNGSLSAVSANAGVATVAPGASAGQFTVTPTGIGSTTITVTAGANTATVTIVVTALTPGPLVVNPTSLSLTTTASPAPLTATEAHYSGTFTAVSANAAVATVAAGGGPGQFVVTPTGAGTTAITVTGGTLTAQVTVTVSAPIVLAASPPWYSNSFDTSVPVGTPGIGDGETTRLTATESGYSGTFTATLGSDCVSAGVIFPTTSNTTPQTNSGSWVLEHPYLSPYPTGPCTITVTDTNGKSATKLFLAQYR